MAITKGLRLVAGTFRVVYSLVLVPFDAGAYPRHGGREFSE
jgi:hypothetical protein